MAQEITQYDVVILGGGALGCTYARYLHPHLKVLICEAGAQLSKKPGEHLKNSYLYQKDIDPFVHVVNGHLHQISIPEDQSFLDTISPAAFNPGPFLRNGQNPEQKANENLRNAYSTYSMGGMVTHWTCAIPRHHAKLERLLDGKEYIPEAEFDALYTEAEKLLQRHTDLFDDSVRNDVVLEALKIAYKGQIPENEGPQNLPMAGQAVKSSFKTAGIPWRRIKWTGADVILGDLSEGKTPETEFKILLEHVAKKIVWETTKDGHHTVKHVEVKDLSDGCTKIIKAKYYIVTANAILTPQILVASGIGSNQHITENQGKVTDPRNLPVGRYLTDQPMTFCQIILHNDLVKKAAKLKKEKYPDMVIPPGDLTGLPYNEPPPNVWIPCSVNSYKVIDHKTGEWVTVNRQWHAQVHRDAFSYGAIPPNIDERVVVDLRWFGANRPKFENRVVFSTNPDNTDRLGLPQPTFHYKIPEEDVPTMHAMMGDMTYAAAALGGFFPGAEPRYMPPGAAIHFQGSFRMGKENDGKSVTDTNSRVWGFDNLHLGGNGIIPTATSSNPTLTSCALAYKASQFIIAEFKKVHHKC